MVRQLGAHCKDDHRAHDLSDERLLQIMPIHVDDVRNDEWNEHGCQRPKNTQFGPNVINEIKLADKYDNRRYQYHGVPL